MVFYALCITSSYSWIAIAGAAPMDMGQIGFFGSRPGEIVPHCRRNPVQDRFPSL
jgi:hypothetical protein